MNTPDSQTPKQVPEWENVYFDGLIKSNPIPPDRGLPFQATAGVMNEGELPEAISAGKGIEIVTVEIGQELFFRPDGNIAWIKCPKGEPLAIPAGQRFFLKVEDGRGPINYLCQYVERPNREDPEIHAYMVARTLFHLTEAYSFLKKQGGKLTGDADVAKSEVEEYLLSLLKEMGRVAREGVSKCPGKEKEVISAISSLLSGLTEGYEGLDKKISVRLFHEVANELVRRLHSAEECVQVQASSTASAASEALDGERL